MKNIILVCGFPGIGKSTLCRALAARIPSAYFLDADRFYKSQGGTPENIDELPEEERTRRREIYVASKAAEISRLLKSHDIVITDGLFTHRRDRQFVRLLAQKEGVRLLTLRVVCPEEIVKERIFAHRDHIMRPEKRWEAYLRAKLLWEDIESEHMEIDSTQPLDVNRILNKIR